MALSYLPVFIILPKIWQVVCRATPIVKPFTAQTITGVAFQASGEDGKAITSYNILGGHLLRLSHPSLPWQVRHRFLMAPEP